MRPPESFIGQPIRCLQTMLRVLAEYDESYLPMIPDGIYGPETMAAVTKASFERWYASQSDYRTVEDQKLDADIVASTYGLPEMARMLGVHRQTIYYIVANGDFELIKVGRYKRATKESFEKWYQNQTRYRLVAEDGQERR